VSLAVGLDVLKRRIFCPCQDKKPVPLIHQLMHYMKYVSE